MTDDRERSDGPGDEAEAPNAGQTPATPRGDGSGCLFGSLAVSAWFIAVWLGFHLINGLMGPPRYVYYSVTAEFEIDGEIVRASRIVECRRTVPYFLGTEFDISGSAQTYRRGPSDLALPLGDGSALVIKSRPVCQAPHVLSEDDDYFPLVYWIDDVENPRFGEAYLDKSYFDQPNARVRLISVDGEVARRSPVWLGWLPENSYDIEAEVPWLGLPREQRGIMGGIFIVVAEKELWQHIEGSETFVRSFTGPRFVTRDELRPVFGDQLFGNPPETLAGFLQYVAEYGMNCEPDRDTSRASVRDRNICEILRTRTYAMQPLGPHEYSIDFPGAAQWPLGLLARWPWTTPRDEKPAWTYHFFGQEVVRDPEEANLSPVIVDPQNTRLLRIDGYIMNISE